MSQTQWRFRVRKELHVPREPWIRSSVLAGIATVDLPGCKTGEDVVFAIAMDMHCETPGVVYRITDQLDRITFLIYAPIDREDAIGRALPSLELY